MQSQRQVNNDTNDDVSVITNDTNPSQLQNRPNSSVVVVNRQPVAAAAQDNSMKWESTIDKNTGRKYWFNR